MVRVISVHHFTSQDVCTIPKPLASAIAGNKLLLSAENRAAVEVRNLDNCAKLSHTFQTIDQASQIVYSPVGNYVATLEGSVTNHNTVRAYTNWNNARIDGAPIRPRIAARVGPSLSQSQDAAVDMIEFPQREVPLRIATCPSTGNLIMAATNVLVIYKYVIKTLEASKAKYVDFEDCIHIFHTFPVPKEVELVEDVVACLAEDQVHVFKIKLVPVNDAQPKSMSLYSVSSEVSSVCSEQQGGLDPLSSLFVRRSSSDSGSSDMNDVKVVDGANTLKVNVTAKRQQDSEANDHHLEGFSGNVRRHPQHIIFDSNLRKVCLPEVEKSNKELSSIGSPRIMEQMLGPISNASSGPVGGEVIVKLVPTMLSAEQDFMVEAEAVTMVHCKLNRGEDEVFQNLVLKPVFWREFKMRQKGMAAASANSPILGQSSLASNPLHSKVHQHLMSLSLCFTSRNEGYLFHLPGHLRKAGKGCGVQRIATYPFTGPVTQIALEPTVLHALTATGLETYTLRSGYHTVMEAETLNDRTNACPGSDIPICLVGLRPFLGAKHLQVSGDHLVLLSAVDDTCLPADDEAADTSKWTAYSLSLPSSLALYNDMIQLANMNRTLSPHGYFQLLCEGHMVLRTSYHQLTWLNNDPDQTASIRAQFKNNCLLLANYYVASAEPKEAKMALPYFRLSDLSAIDVLNQAKDQWLGSPQSTNKRLPGGLTHYISEIVLRPVAGCQEDVQESKLADLIIDLLGQYAVDCLAVLVLKSPTFRQFKTSKIHGHFKKHLEVTETLGTAETIVAFSLLCVDMGEAGVHDLELARSYLQAVPPLQMSEVLIDYHNFLLLDDSGNQSSAFSEFAILVRDSVPDTFVEVMVSLIKSEQLSLQFVLGLFIGSFVSMSSSKHQSLGSKECSATHNTAMLQLFLETYFTELLSDHETLKKELVLDPDQLQALHTLVRSYLTSLSIPVRFVEKNIDSNLYVTRRNYLEKLPPFDKISDDKEMLNADSPDFWCQNSLLKLQSLLCCHALCGDRSSHQIVKSFLDVKPNSIGSLSLRVLCNDMEKDQASNVQLLADNHPEILLPYAKETQFELFTWKLLLKGLQDRLSSEEQLKHEAWYAAMQEVLDHLAQTLALDAFLEILPTSNPHANEDFQGHIQMCRKNQQAHQIQDLIVSTGHKLLSTLTL